MERRHGIIGRRFRDQISQVRPRLDSKYTSSTTPRQQIRVIGFHVAVPRSYWSAIPTPLFIYISQLLRDSFSVCQQPPIWDPPSHYSMPTPQPWSGNFCNLFLPSKLFVQCYLEPTSYYTRASNELLQRFHNYGEGITERAWCQNSSGLNRNLAD